MVTQGSGELGELELPLDGRGYGYSFEADTFLRTPTHPRLCFLSAGRSLSSTLTDWAAPASMRHETRG